MKKVVLTIAGAIAVLSCGGGGESTAPTTPSLPTASVVPRAYSLTDVSGTKIPMIYYAGSTGSSWVDSSTVSIQADSFIVFRTYGATVAPPNAPHGSLETLLVAGGRLQPTGIAVLHYADSTSDTARVLTDGTVTVNFSGRDLLNNRASYGTWEYKSAYTGPLLNPVPSVTSFAPGSVQVGGPDLALQVIGVGFTPNMTVTWVSSVGSATGPTNTPLAFKYQGGNDILVTIPASLISVAGTFQITLGNPNSGDVIRIYNFTVTPLKPVLTSISPATIGAGSASAMLTLNGTGLGGATVMWNGVARGNIGSFSPNVGYYQIPDADLQTAGPVLLSVHAGSQTSDSVVLNIIGAVPKVLATTNIGIHVRGVAPDPTRSVVYASVDSTDGTYPSRILALDPASASVLWSVNVGGMPDSLAVTDDGQYLYVSHHNDTTVTRINLGAHSIDMHFSLGSGAGTIGPYSVWQMATVPGQPHAIAIQRNCQCASLTTDVGLTIFDDGIPRPQSGRQALQAFVFGGSSSTVYGTQGGTFYAMSVNSSGVTVTTTRQNAFVYPYPGSMLYNTANGKLYMSDATIYNPSDGTSSVLGPGLPGVINNFVATPATFSSDGHTIYIRNGNSVRINAYSLDTNAPMGSINPPVADAPAAGFVRSGTSFLVFATVFQVYFIRTDLVH